MRRSALHALAFFGATGVAACSNGRTDPIAHAREAVTTELVAGELTVDHADEIDFGRSLAVAGGMTLVGAPGATRGDVVSGAVFAFLRKGSSWASAKTLWPPKPVDGQRFGETVVSTGELAAIGGPGSSAGSAVWLFPWDGAWAEAEAVLTAPSSDGASDASFGSALALDATTLLVGAPLADSYRGHVYVYERIQGDWVPTQTLPASSESADSALYGIALALEGDRVLVGAPGEAPTGAVYVLERAPKVDGGSSSWSTVQRIAEPDATASFGSAVAQTADVLAVGAPEDGRGGAVYTYRLQGGSWRLDKALKRDAATPYDYLGSALGFSDSSLFVGSPGFTTDDASGRVYEYRMDYDWVAGATLLPSVHNALGTFGGTLAVSHGSTLLVADKPVVYAYVPGLGSTCSGDGDCASGHCSEKVCCDEACNDDCHSCLAELKGGKDAVDGACGPVAKGSDPRNDCAESTDLCGTTGACTAEGTCRLAPVGTSCQSAGCFSPTEAVEAGECNGAGDCRIPEPTVCAAGYTCHDSACSSSCQGEEDCDQAAGYYCYELACMKGAWCSPDRSIAIDTTGHETPCLQVLCQDGACPAACARTSDCAGDLVCDPYSHGCVTEASLTEKKTSSGASCALGGRGAEHAGGAFWVVALLFGLRRSRKKTLARTVRSVAPTRSESRLVAMKEG